MDGVNQHLDNKQYTMYIRTIVEPHLVSVKHINFL